MKMSTSRPVNGLLQRLLAGLNFWSSFRGILVILASEIIAAGIERADVNDTLRFARDHFFDFQSGRIELLRKRIGVDNREQNPLSGWHMKLGRFEAMVANGNRSRKAILCGGAAVKNA